MVRILQKHILNCNNSIFTFSHKQVVNILDLGTQTEFWKYSRCKGIRSSSWRPSKQEHHNDGVEQHTKRATKASWLKPTACMMRLLCIWVIAQTKQSFASIIPYDNHPGTAKNVERSSHICAGGFVTILSLSHQIPSQNSITEDFKLKSWYQKTAYMSKDTDSKWISQIIVSKFRELLYSATGSIF